MSLRIPSPCRPDLTTSCVGLPGFGLLRSCIDAIHSPFHLVISLPRLPASESTPFFQRVLRIFPRPLTV